MMVWQDADSPPPSGVKCHRSAPKSDSPAVRESGIQAGGDLKLLSSSLSNQYGGIMHALQPEVVQKIIARFGKRWWKTGSSKVAGSVVCTAVIRNNLGNFGDVFDELYSAKQKSLATLWAKLRASHGHAARAHRAKLANVMGHLFHETAASDPRTNFVNEHVFGVQHWAPMLLQDHAVIKQLWCQSLIGALVPSFALKHIL